MREKESISKLTFLLRYFFEDGGEMTTKQVLSSNPCEQDSMNHSDMCPGSPNTSGGSSDGPFYVVMVPTPDAMAQNINHNNNNHPHQQKRKLNPVSILSTAADLSMSSNPTSGMNSRPVPRDERRRATHNEVERRRRDKINTWITKLAKLIPDGCEDNTKQGQSKGGILAKACVHISNLTEQANRLQVVSKENESLLSEEVRRLQKEVAELKCENHGLKMALSIHGLRVPEDCNGSKDERNKDKSSPQSSPERRSTVLQQQVNTISPTTSVISRSATTPSSNSATKHS